MDINNLIKEPKLLYTPRTKLEGIQDSWLKELFPHHYNNCQYFRNLCDAYEITPSNFKGMEDIRNNKLPVLPTEIFREEDVLSVDKSKIFNVATTSGTTDPKKRGKAYRDKDTYYRIAIANYVMCSEICRMNNGFYALLTPQTGIGLRMPDDMTECFKPYGEVETFIKIHLDKLDNNRKPLVEFDPKYLVERVNNNPLKPRHILGAPAGFLGLFSYLEKTNQKLILNGGTIMTGGGWRKKGTMEGPEFIDPLKMFLPMVTKFTDIQPENLRKSVFDAYSMSELGTAILSCRESPFTHLHPYPLQIPRIRKLDGSNKLTYDDGHEGELELFDLTITSYPCFIKTSDKAKIYWKECSCGLTTPKIEIVGRIKQEGTEEENESCGEHTAELLSRSHTKVE